MATSNPTSTADQPSITTLAAPTQIPTIQATATPTLSEMCISIEQQFPADLELSGVWVLDAGVPYLENLVEHTTYRIPLGGDGQISTQQGDMAISPDGTHMAYIDKYYDTNHRLEKRVLRVIRSSGHALDMSFWHQDWQEIIGWVDNQNLAVRDGHGKIIILNPISGNWQDFAQSPLINAPDYPYYRWNTPLYSPNLIWLVTRPDYDKTVIKNTQTGQTAWQVSGSGEVDWSANNTLAVVSDYLITIMFDGKQTAQLVGTRLGLNYISSIKLSPDGQKLYFVGYKDQNYQVFIWDINKREFAQFCDTANFQINWTTPAWSPDSRYVIQSVYTYNDYYFQSFDILIDTLTWRAYELNHGYYHHRIAWLAQP